MKKSKLKNIKLEYMKRLEHSKRMKKVFEDQITENATILNELETIEELK